MRSPLIAWTIYNRPADYPHGVVARQWYIGLGEYEPAAVILAPSVEAVRQLIPPGLVRFEREPGDDPCIVETWL